MDYSNCSEYTDKIKLDKKELARAIELAKSFILDEMDLSFFIEEYLIGEKRDDIMLSNTDYIIYEGIKKVILNDRKNE